LDDPPAIRYERVTKPVLARFVVKATSLLDARTPAPPAELLLNAFRSLKSPPVMLTKPLAESLPKLWFVVNGSTTPAFAEPATATAAATPTIEEMKVLFRI
jgi:hypothetical protein